MRSMMKKTTLREIRQSFGRYFAILAIVLLGVGFFAGLKVTKSAMVAAADDYLEENGFYNYRLLSSYGFEEEDVEALSAKPDARAVEGAYSADALITSEKDENEQVLRFHSLTDRVNTVVLVAGRMPERADECVVDSLLFPESAIGTKVILEDEGAQDEDDEDEKKFAFSAYTITGLVQSPLYAQFERGNTSIGNGKVSGFAYLMPEGFACEYYTEIYVKLDEDFFLYSDEYNDFIKEKDSVWEEYCREQGQRRYRSIVDDADGEVADAESELKDAKAKLADAEREVADAEGELADKKAEAEEELADAKKELLDAEKKAADGERQLADAKREIEDTEKQLSDKTAELDAAEEKLPLMAAAGMPTQEAAAQIAYGRAQVSAAYGELDAAKREIQNREAELADAKREIEDGWKEYDDALADFDREIADAEKKIADAKEELADAKEKIADAEAELADAKEEIAKLKEPDTYVLGRNTNIGYVCFESDSDIVDGVANVFPVFFFLVAALVCMTTMSRMVEEQRTQIGVLKALGYGEGRIMGKYLFYSGSAAFIGAVIGFFFGTWGMPRVIWFAYGILYRMQDIRYVFNTTLAMISLVVALACSMGVTYLTCRKVLKEEAATLMRPKAPKAGKRVLLERIPFIWGRMKFLQKVSYRNVVRYKKRFFMMVIGISGCTALLLTAFGLKDSIADLAKMQFHEIQVYDLSVTLGEGLDEMDEEEREAILSLILDRGGEYLPVQETVMDLVAGGGVKSVNLVVAKEPEKMNDYVDLHTKGGERVEYPTTGFAIITDKAAKDYDIHVGDTIRVRNEDMQEVTATVSGIFKNYVYSYVYLDEATYEKAFGEVNYKSLYALLPGETDVHELSAALMGTDKVNAVTVNADVEDRVTSMLSSLNYIVVVIVLCAAALAFIVLYNLNNINITERISEIATLKVLGFYRRETEKYVFRENLVLTGIGCAVGLLLGRALHAFVMHEINIDMIALEVRVLPVSYVYSIVLTFVFALLVNRLMSVKLDRVGMAESLKSVD